MQTRGYRACDLMRASLWVTRTYPHVVDTYSFSPGIQIRTKNDEADMPELEVMHACRGYWVGPAATALMQVDAWSRNHVADYLMPEVRFCFCCTQPHRPPI